MEEKLCHKCGEVLPVSAFNKDKHTKTGLSCYCRECRKRINSEWAKTDVKKAYRAKHYLAHPQEFKARRAVRTEIRSGRMAPAAACECVDCGAQAMDLHHHSYEPEHWLDVVPLCRSCHQKRHQLISA